MFGWSRKEKLQKALEKRQERQIQIQEEFNRKEKKLWQAIKDNNLAEVKDLMEKPSVFRDKVRNSCSDENGMTPFMYACKLGRAEIVEYWLKNVRFGLFNYDNDNRNALMWAACSGSLETVKKLTKDRVNFSPDQSENFLQWRAGATLPDMDKYKEHIEIWAHIRAVIVDRMMYLVKPSYNGKIEDIQALLSPNPYGKITIDEPNYNGWTILKYAAFHQNVEMVKRLVDMGADVNAVDDYKETVVMAATRNPHPKLESIKYLVEHGANLLARTSIGERIDETIAVRFLVDSDVHFYIMKSVQKALEKRQEEIRKAQKQRQSDDDKKLLDGLPDDVTKSLISDEAFLNRVIDANRLEPLFDRLPYRNATTVYHHIRQKVSKDQKIRIENKIRNARQRDGE